MSPRASPTSTWSRRSSGDSYGWYGQNTSDTESAGGRTQSASEGATEKTPAPQQVPRPTPGTTQLGVLGTAGGTAGQAAAAMAVVSASVGLVILGILNRFHQEPGDDGSGGELLPCPSGASAQPVPRS